MIIAIDPGQHTGIAVRLDNGEWATLMADKLPDDTERLNMVLDTLTDLIQRNTTTAIVVENFKTMGYLSKYGIETIELIGAVKAMCFVYDVKLVRQDPSHRDAFTQTSNRMIKDRARTLKIPMSDHEVSALAHLLCYEYSLTPRDTKRKARLPPPTRPPPFNLGGPVSTTVTTIPIPTKPKENTQ